MRPRVTEWCTRIGRFSDALQNCSTARFSHRQRPAYAWAGTMPPLMNTEPAVIQGADPRLSHHLIHLFDWLCYWRRAAVNIPAANLMAKGYISTDLAFHARFNRCAHHLTRGCAE
jgi:hypothetical protein